MASVEDLIGTVIDGKYEVTRLLGRGGMGEVYAGKHLQLGRPVAIKVLHGALSENETFVQRFAREARTAAMLEHPNAVHVYDFGPLGAASAYLVMEYVDGVTLREIIRRNGAMPLHTVLELLRQAGGAIAAAHARGIVHRDLKPENMMVRTDDTGRLQLKVVDFGLAKLLENQTSQLTNQSELIGTPRYMAPEQFQGNKIDERVDVYALGCVCFELISGKAPFEGTFIEVVGKHVYAEVPRFGELSLDVPEVVEMVVRRALAKDPAERTRTAGEFVREFESACGADVAALAAEPITMPLAEPQSMSTAPYDDRATFVDRETSTPANEYVTNPDATRPPPEDLRTRVSAVEHDEETRMRHDAAPTLAMPNRSNFVVPIQAEPSTMAIGDVPSRLRPRGYAKPIAVGTGVLALACASFVYFNLPTPQPAPSAPPVSVPAPQPATPQEPTAPAETAPEPPASDKPTPPKEAHAASPKKSGAAARTNEDAQDPDVSGNEVDIDPDSIVMPPEMPPAEARKLRRALKQAQLERRRARRAHAQVRP